MDILLFFNFETVLQEDARRDVMGWQRAGGQFLGLFIGYLQSGGLEGGSCKQEVM